MYPSEIISKMKKKFPDLVWSGDGKVQNNQKVNKMKNTINKLFEGRK
jgi:hypothetical protein